MDGNEHDAFKMLRLIRMDLTQLQARVTDLASILAQAKLEDPARAKCEHCGLSFRWATQLSEHAYLQHGAPEPQHWIEAEARSV